MINPWLVGLGLALLAAPAAQAQFTFTTNNGSITLTSYAGAGGTVIIPASVGGLPVATIGNGEDSVFANTGVTSVTVPASVTSLADSSFAFCASLISVFFASNAPSADSTVFSTDNLTAYCLPGTTGWGDFFVNTFVPVLLQGALQDLDFSYTINADNPTTITITGYAGPGEAVDIPTNINGLLVTGVGDLAFEGASLTNVTIPGGVGSIGAASFASCQGLANVTIPDSVTNIGDGAFDGCTRLKYALLGSNVANIGVNAFSYCTNLTNITIPISVTNIAAGAFSACDNLGEASIGHGVTDIGDNAFAGCSSLTNAILGSSVTNIGYAAFDGTSLASLTIPDSVLTIGGYAFNGTTLTTLTTGNNVTSIGDEAFECNFLTNISVTASVTNIADQAFNVSPSLRAITVNSNNPAYSSVAGVLFDKSVATLIQYPADKVGTSYAIPNTVTSIADGALYGCEKLTSVTIPDSVTNISSNAFYYCTSLASITIPDSVTAIGDYAFVYCYDLTSVTISAGVTSIGESAFAFSSSLASVYFEGNAPKADCAVFGLDSRVNVYYLAGTTGWGPAFPCVPATTLTTVAITANPASGLAPLNVRFTAAAQDGAGHAVTNWNWTFGDGATSTNQNPSHTYTNPGIFSADLVETHKSLVPVAGGGTTIRAASYAGQVLNGSFETGNFIGWSLSGDTSGTLVDDGTVTDITAYAGNEEAALGTSGSPGYISQTLLTTPGATYLLSFWLDNPLADPVEFLVSWNGSTLLDTTNLVADNWTNLQFVVSATGTGTVLQFGFQDTNGDFGLDDITVAPTQPVISGLSVAGTNLALEGFNGQTGGTYYVLTSTDLSLPLSQWTPVATNILNTLGNFAITVTNAVISGVPQSFYILQSQ